MAAAAPERLSAADRRQAIVSAAQPLFAARGFDAVTTREVARAASVSEALLYRHFSSKAQLYDAVLASCIHRTASDAQRIQALPDGTRTLVLAVYLVMRNIQLPPPQGGAEQDIPRLILRSLLSDGEFARHFLRFAAGHWVEKIERCVHAGIEAGEIDGSAEEAVSGCWFSHHLAAALVFFSLPGGPVVDYPLVDREGVFEQSVLFALRGLGLTRQAIERYFQPQAFALLTGGEPRP